MKVILLRHGATRANAERLYCGKTDLPLSDVGRQELQALRCSRVYPDIASCIVISSGLLRADETISELFGRAPDRRMAGFREMDFGLFEMRGYDDLKNDEAYIAWITDETGDLSTPGGESRNVFRRRVLEAFSGIERDALIVCHGGVIVEIMSRLFPEENRNFYQWQPSNGCGYEITFTEGAKSAFRAIPLEETRED